MFLSHCSYCIFEGRNMSEHKCPCLSSSEVCAEVMMAFASRAKLIPPPSQTAVWVCVCIVAVQGLGPTDKGSEHPMRQPARA